ncbi:hypothetical protein TWF730_000045 [Orbilia blumenaviensis]|uniref:Peptidase A1 domain-containing protein n=1 Tax=Orbilia blumenaviensis TaxID=1796055 RepID=A0AAV9VML6_9PEZI
MRVSPTPGKLLRLSVVITIFFIILVSLDIVSASDHDPRCSNQPTPIAIRFGDVSLSSRNDKPEEPTVFGLETILGEHFFGCHINILEPDIGVSMGTRTCTGIEDKPRNCYLNTTRYQYDIRTNIISAGVFDEQNSATFREINSTARPSDETQLGEDTVRIGQRSLEDFPFRLKRISGLASVLPAYIGLNNESRLLEALFTKSLISAKAWSFFSGWLGPGGSVDMIRDGSLVLGGYDSEVLAPRGKFTEFPMFKSSKRSCPLSLEISGVKWLGGNVSISTFGPYFTACVNPGSSRLEFPFDIWIQLRDLHKSSTVASFGSGPIWANAATDNIIENQRPQNPIAPIDQQGIIRDFGAPERIPPTFERYNMEIQLKDGPSILVPGHQIFQRRREINNTGFIQARSGGDGVPEDPTRVAVLTYSNKNGDSDPVFGLPFLAGAYLMVNYENSTFGIAPIPTEGSNKTSLVPINHPSCYAQARGDSKPDAKVIAPATIGSVIGVALIVLGGSILWRKYGTSGYSEQPIIPLGEVGPEKDGSQRFEAGGREVDVPLSDSTQIYQTDGNPVHQFPDDYGSATTSWNRSTRSIYELS